MVTCEVLFASIALILIPHSPSVRPLSALSASLVRFHRIVKNSWSTYWGDEGFIKMSRKDNNCGVATMPTYVVLA
jgi:hypothetical protein